MTNQIAIPEDAIIGFCKQNQIRKLALFGSVLGDNFGPDSDVDILVEFEPEAIIGWKIVTIEDNLSQLLQRKVDLRTPQELSRHFRQKVLDAAQVIYERAG